MPKAEFTAQALNVLWAERCNTEDTFFKPSEMKDFRLSEKTEPMSIPPTRLDPRTVTAEIDTEGLDPGIARQLREIIKGKPPKPDWRLGPPETTAQLVGHFQQSRIRRKNQISLNKTNSRDSCAETVYAHEFTKVSGGRGLYANTGAKKAAA